MPHLTRLSARIQDVLFDDLFIESFSNITHLDMLGFISDSWERHWKVLTHLPRLTHLSIPDDIRLAVASKFLLFCPLLKVMIVIPGPLRYSEDALEMVDDDRFVLLESLSYTYIVHDWETGANGGVDIWFFGELIAFARHSEYSLGSSLAQLLY